jgi:cell division protease FtsH
MDKLSNLNLFGKVKGRLNFSFKSLKNPNYWFLFAAIFAVTALIISNYCSPENTLIDYVYQAHKDKKPIKSYLYQQTAFSRNYLFDINNKAYIVVLLLKDIDQTAKEIKEKTDLTLGSTEMTYFEKQKTEGFPDLFWFLAIACGVVGLSRVYFNNKKAKSTFVRESIKTKFKDVAGIDSIRGELEEVVEHFKDSAKIKSLGGKVMKGVVLHGPPGTGKTLMAKAVAGETKSHFIATSGSGFVEVYVGQGAKRVREAFNEARNNTPCVIFVDEIDAFAKKRGGRDSNSEYEQTVNEFLNQMDGFADNTGVLVIAATNRLDTMDEALLRPGRFDRKIKVDLPSVKGRKEIFDLYVNKLPAIGKDVDTAQLAKVTTGFSGADIDNLTNEAVYLAYKKWKKKLRTTDVAQLEDFIQAKDTVVLGALRDIKLSDKEKESTAYHEMGHALVSHLKKAGEVNQVTILPRGQALGVTHMTPDEQHSYTKEDLKNKIMMFLGGKCAETLKFGYGSTGASNDLERATSLARQIVCNFGMGKHGPINLQYGSAEYQLLSEQMKFSLDQEVLDFLRDTEVETMQLLRDHLPILDALSVTLIEKETILLDEFRSLIESQLKKQTV